MLEFKSSLSEYERCCNQMQRKPVCTTNYKWYQHTLRVYTVQWRHNQHQQSHQQAIMLKYLLWYSSDAGPRLNIKTVFPISYGDFYSSLTTAFLYNGNLYTGKTPSLYETHPPPRPPPLSQPTIPPPTPPTTDSWFKSDISMSTTKAIDEKLWRRVKIY